MSVENLEIYKKTEKLMFRVYPALKNFPKSEKFALCQSIKENFFQLLTHISC